MHYLKEIQPFRIFDEDYNDDCDKCGEPLSLSFMATFFGRFTSMEMLVCEKCALELRKNTKEKYTFTCTREGVKK